MAGTADAISQPNLPHDGANRLKTALLGGRGYWCYNGGGGLIKVKGLWG